MALNLKNKLRLGDYVKIRTGKLDANVASENGKYPFFTCAIEPLKIDQYTYECECVLVAGNGDLNVKYYNGKFDAYQRTYIIESIDDSKLYVPYLYRFLDEYVKILRAQSIGGVIKYIKLGNLTEAKIYLPDLNEQKGICNNLSKLDELIESVNCQLEDLDLLIKSRFIEMFGDPVTNPNQFPKVALSELADIKIGPFGSLLHKEDYIENGHPIVNPSHIIEGKIAIDTSLTISNKKYMELESYQLHVGDVVLGRRGEMGRCAVVLKNGLLCGTGSMIIRTKGEVTADFIQKIISFPTFRKSIENMSVGQTMPNLNVPIVSNFFVIKPPIEVQKEYYAFIDKIVKSKLEVQKSLEELETLKKSLMQQYFG